MKKKTMSNKRINNLDLVRIRHFCTSEDIIQKVKREPTEREKILQIPQLVRAGDPEWIRNS